MKTVTHPNPSSNRDRLLPTFTKPSAAAPNRSTCATAGIPGRDVENWVQAEQEILREAAGYSHRTALVVKVNGVRYVGEYSVDSADSYTPVEFTPGDPITLRFDGDKMFGKRHAGKELEN